MKALYCLWIDYGCFSGFVCNVLLVLPIAPQNIPSWIPLLHLRSHPTSCRHLIVRCTTALCSMVRLNHSDVIVRWQSQTPRSSAHSQTEPRAQEPSATQRPMQSEFAIALFHCLAVFFIVIGCLSWSFTSYREEAPVLPDSILISSSR